uniref:hypothetical protein n=1 Tax=Cephaleuros karstenii TaxID=1985640 RepID=UPI001EDF75E2|nr:hypothetical protein MFR52_pgp065 [Cephaleuros karstenii]UIB39094.1 hypothetical protein [Cephaleuros karstenii]
MEKIDGKNNKMIPLFSNNSNVLNTFIFSGARPLTEKNKKHPLSGGFFRVKNWRSSSRQSLEKVINFIRPSSLPFIDKKIWNKNFRSATKIVDQLFFFTIANHAINSSDQ